MYYRLPRLKYEPLPLPDEATRYATRFFRDPSLRVLFPPRAIMLFHEDPFIEKIRLRVRWGWQDATARERLPGGGDAGRC